MTLSRSAQRYRPITDWLDPSKKPVAERHSREVRHADVQITRRTRAYAHADVQKQEERRPRRPQPASQSPHTAWRTWSQNPVIQADVRETRPGDDACFDEMNGLPKEEAWEEEECLPPRQAPRRVQRSHHMAPVSRRPRMPAWLPWVVVLIILIPSVIGVYSAAWSFHARGAQDTVSTRFGSHAPADTLVLGNRVVVARNNGNAITVYFIPANGGQGTKLVQALPSSEWGTPSLVIPNLSLEKGILYLQLVGVPSYPNWAQPEATYRLQSTADGYQAVQVA